MIGPKAAVSGYGRIEVKPQQYPQWMCTLMHWVMSVAERIEILKALSDRDFAHFDSTVPGRVAASTSKRLERSKLFELWKRSRGFRRSRYHSS